MRFKINGAKASTLMVICKSVAKVLEVLQEQIPDTLVILLNKATDKKRLLEAYLDKDNQVGGGDLVFATKNLLVVQVQDWPSECEA